MPDDFTHQLGPLGPYRVNTLLFFSFLFIVKWQKSQEGKRPSDVGTTTVYLWEYSEKSGRSVFQQSSTTAFQSTVCCLF